MWFTFHEDTDICYLLEINKDHEVTMIVTDFQRRYRQFRPPARLRNHFVRKILVRSQRETGPSSLSRTCIASMRPPRETFYIQRGAHLLQDADGDDNEETDVDQSCASVYVHGCQRQCSIGIDAVLRIDDVIDRLYDTTHHVQSRSPKIIAPYLNHVYKKRSVEKVDATTWTIICK